MTPVHQTHRGSCGVALVIAHRLNTIVGADNIMVIKDGRLAEYGDHKSLMEQGGIYHSMATKRAVSTGRKN